MPKSLSGDLRERVIEAVQAGASRRAVGYVRSCQPSVARNVEITSGHLEKLLSLPIADSPGVNVNESGRERNGIIRRQFCGGRQLRAIFRGALQTCWLSPIWPESALNRQKGAALRDRKSVV